MFGTIRKHSQALWIPIIIVIVISFVVYFQPNQPSGDQRSEAIDELKFPRQQVLLEQALNLFQRFGGMLPPGFDASALANQIQPHNLMGNDFQTQQKLGDLDDYPGLDFQAQMRMLRLRKASDLGIRVSLDTAEARLEQMFSQPGGGFSQENFTSVLTPLARAGFLHFDTEQKEVSEIGKKQFRQFILEGIIMEQLDELMTRSSGFFPDKAIEASLIEANKKYTAQAVFFSSSNHLASVTNAIDANSTIITKHYETMVDQYRIEEKRIIGYVKISNVHYLPQAEKKINFPTLVTDRIKLHHSSTNSVNFFRDTNGTKLPNGPALVAAAQADMREKHQEEINQHTDPPTKNEANLFLRKIFENQPQEKWAIPRLKQESKAWVGEGKQPLNYREATVSRDNENKVLPQGVIDDVYGPFVSALKGDLYPRLIKIPGDGFYLIGFVDNIAGRPRKFEELNDNEKSEVKTSFIEEEVARRTKEDAHEFREGIMELMGSGQSFADSIRLSPNPKVQLPAMKLNSTNQVAGLKGLASLDQIQSAIRLNPDEAKPGWISEFTPAANEKSDGFVVHVSAVEAGEPPTPAELQRTAESERQRARNFSSSMMAARFGMVPNWLQADVQALNGKLYKRGLEQRKDNIEFEIESKQNEAKEIEEILREIESGIRKEDEETRAGLEKSLAEARREILSLNELSKKLPQLIEEIGNAAGAGSDAKK
jgi:hypothetical protein